MKYKVIISILLVFLLVFSFVGCGDLKDNKSQSSTSSSKVSQPSMSVGEQGEIFSGQTQVSGITNQSITNLDTSVMFTNADLEQEVDTSSAITITLNGNSASCSSSTNYVKLGNKYVIISGGGVYVLTGNSQDLIVYVQADKSLDKVTIILENVNMQHSSFAPIYVLSANKTFIYARGNNYLSTTGNFVQKDTNNVDGTLFSKDDLCLKGSGSLNITNNYGHGIVAKDDFKIVNLNLTINVSGHGIDSNDSTRISGANVNITSGQDGIKVENLEITTVGYFYMANGNLTIKANQDGIDCSEKMRIDGGNIKIFAGDSGVVNNTLTSKNALKAGTNMGLYGGNIILYSSEAGLKAPAFNINGATILSLSAGLTNGVVNGIRFNSDNLLNTNSLYTINQNSFSVYSFTAEQSFYNLLYVSPTITGGGFSLTK